MTAAAAVAFEHRAPFERPRHRCWARIIRKRQNHELGVLGQRALHKHDALESGLDAGRLQSLHALANKDAQLVERKQRRE